MKKLIAALLLAAMALSLAACTNNGDGAETTNNGRDFEVIPLETLDSSPIDNSFKDENGKVIFEASPFRVVDKVEGEENAYVIILMNVKYSQEIYKAYKFETTEEAYAFVAKLSSDGTANNLHGFGQAENVVYYNLTSTDETYGKFLNMPREMVLDEFE